MGDMKTPDFDDLLAAFDIPDIDAKEAIQSAPEEAEGPHGAAGATLGKQDSVVGVGSSLRPPSPADPQADTSIVSVIVKNKVRLETVDGDEGDTDQDPIDVIAGVDVGPRLGACAPGMAESEALNHNGFGASGVSTPLPLSQAQSNGAPWSMNSPKVSSEAAGASKAHKQGGNIFNRLKPLVAQGSGDPVGRARKMQLLQQQHQQQQDTGQERADGVKASLPSSSSLSAGSSPLAAGGPVGLASPFFPPSKPLLPNPPSALSSHPLHSSQPFNGAPKSGPAGFQHQQMEEDDSDPDLGSPLVIQETPDSPTCTQLTQRYKSDSVSTQPTSSTSSHPKPGDTPSGASLTSSTPQSGSTEIPQLEDRHPEHVIEERDSPESPEPEIPKSTAHVSTKRCSSPAVASTPPPSELREPKEEEEEMEVGNGIDRDVDGKADKGENARTSEEKMEVDDGKPKPPSTDGDVPAPAASGAPSRPLKVRIKTIKTSTGGITRTVTRVAPKGAAAKGLDAKAQSGERKLLGNKAQKLEASPGHMTTTSQKVSALNALPVSTLAASSVMLAAATKVQNKMAASDKAKVSATAVSITKSAALPATPAVTSSPKFSVAAGGISVRTATNKTANGGSGTLSPNKPASIVNSTGAVISRSQSSLVEAFNKILNSKNLLPSYKPDLSAPPPPEWGLPLPATGYRCLECGDAFALERSLARHYDRRSLRIEVTCNHCAKRLAFFNKCSLLLHAREHKERGLVMQCSHLVMRPVTVEQMIGQQDITPIGGLLTSSSSSPPVSSPSTTSGGPAMSANSSPMKDATSPAASQPRPVRRAPQGPQALMPLPCKKADVLQYHNFKCPECQTQFSGKAELVTHFQQIRAAPNSTCTQCSPPMMLPNSCAVSAHQRIHKHRAPHVCPECGGIARQASFQTHLEEACLHFARRIGYRCSSCQVVFGGLNSIKSHIQTAHCEVFHKCPSCPMAFKSSPSAQSHISTQHPTLTGGQAKMIYKCVMCDTVFTQKPLLYMHFDTHLAKQKVHVFKCPDCTKLYAQKGSMMEHIKTTHRGPSAKQESQSEAPNPASAPTITSSPSGLKSKSSGKPDNSDGEDWGREQEEEEEDDDDDDDDADEDYEAPGATSAGGSSHLSAQTEWTCPQCQSTFTDNDNYLSHVKTEHGKFPCRICGGTFSTSSSLRRHERVIHEGNKRVFHCQYCTEGKRTFGSRFLLDKHIRLHHRTPDGQGAPVTRKRAATGGEGSSSEQDGEGVPPAVRAGDEEENATEEGEEGSAPPKRTRASVASTSLSELEEEDNVFRCVPCGFSTEDGAEFQRHIPQHRADTASFQCLQCGVCFASAGSLGRHRFITHRVRDTQSEAERGTARPHGSPDGSPAASPQALGEDGDGNLSCRVCGRRFDKASDLNTHFRTHGMAFLTAHKTDKPQ
ncbi:zinc finger protein 687b isoform X1 [Paralichthys olivaceus]|uniref:zinc finger protein 687b isoform X1 n=1 Tax=Paralichthys olivaceus TaxID=8255 RepID=UPI003752876B